MGYGDGWMDGSRDGDCLPYFTYDEAFQIENRETYVLYIAKHRDNRTSVLGDEIRIQIEIEMERWATMSLCHYVYIAAIKRASERANHQGEIYTYV